ncbi:MAG: aminoacyl-tRNA hydrolase [Bdellovibrionales bacterium]|nr:aminoacyl-tRNA hydrolase [Bdellovibrionales bacterium]
MKIVLTKKREVPSSAISTTFVRSSGPGGQNVNKVSTKAKIKIDISQLKNILTTEEMLSIYTKLKNRIDKNGFLHLTCDETRHQNRNLEIGLKRIESKLTQAIKKPKKRKPTKPTKSSKEKRLQYKKIRAEKKKSRAKID